MGSSLAYGTVGLGSLDDVVLVAARGTRRGGADVTPRAEESRIAERRYHENIFDSNKGVEQQSE